MSQINIPLEEFLRPFFDPAEIVHIRVFDDKKNGTFKGQNGLFNLLDRCFKPHTAAYYSTVQINSNYDQTARCPQFSEFLLEILGQEGIFLLQEIFGYLFILVNKGRSNPVPY